MPSGRISRLIDQLVGVRDTMLRIVVLMPKRRKARQTDVRKSLRPAVQPDLGQSDSAIRKAVLSFLERSCRNPVEAESHFINQSRSEDMRLTRHHILSTAWNFVA